MPLFFLDKLWKNCYTVGIMLADLLSVIAWLRVCLPPNSGQKRESVTPVLILNSSKKG